MEKRKIKDLQLKVRDKNGEEGWIELGQVGESIIEDIVKELRKTKSK